MGRDKTENTKKRRRQAEEQLSEEQQYAKKRRLARRIRRAWLLLILLVPIVYLIIQFYAVYYQPYRTQTAIQVTLSDTVPCDGIAVRSEVPLSGYEGGGVLGYAVNDGVRVSAGAPVSNLYADYTGYSNSIKAQIIAEKISNLQSAQEKGVLPNDEVDGILTNLYTDYYSVLDVLNSNDYTELTENQQAFACGVNRLAIATGKVGDYGAAIETLSTTLSVMQQNAVPVQSFAAPVSGYFVSQTDGYETQYTPETVFAFTANEILQHYQNDNAALQNSAGKIITDYKWYYVCVVNEQNAQRFIDSAPDTKVTLDFVNTTAKSVPAYIQSVSEPDENGNVKVILRIEVVHSDIVSLRNEHAEISFKTVTGIRINRSAVHIVDGEWGVYVKYGHLVSFKKITPIFENDEYVLVPLNENEQRTGVNEVKLFDEIITEGKDLYDGKLL